MKLSQKLLGLAGVALADYACCPYDDYGMPDTGCTGQLREKTPFDTGDWQQNDCKAWEFNADAIFDGNDGCSINRGQCGFQRQFAWGTVGATSGNADVTVNSQFGITSDFVLSFGAETDPTVTAAYDTSGTDDFVTDYTNATPTKTSTRTAALGWGIGHAPKLGAVCKLFVPVPPAAIVQVQVAGVHKAGNSLTMFPGQFKPNSAKPAVDGTVFCFSVVNPAEGDVNDNGVGNGNVNGIGAKGRLEIGDDFANLNSLARQAGLPQARNFGDYLVGTASTISGTSGNDLNNSVGGNFDVVAHFTSAWCTRNFNSQKVEMQQSNDANFGDANYYITDQGVTNPHAHNDIVDKRFAPASGTSEYGTYDTASATSGYMRNTVTTGPVDNTDYRWPNQGAWAGYHSVISCAQVFSNTNGHNVWGSDTRSLVMSVSGQDFRQGSTSNCQNLDYRFNVRQVGSDIVQCGPGQLPDNDDKRCTWNWNYSKTLTEPEEFFDRTNNMVFESWDNLGKRKRRQAVSHANADLNSVNTYQPSIQSILFTFTFTDGLGQTFGANELQSLTSDNEGVYVTSDHTSGTTATLACATSAQQPWRDNFPDCFFGDELHFSARYTAKDTSDPRSRINSWFSKVSSNDLV